MIQKILTFLIVLTLSGHAALAADIHHFEVLVNPDTVSVWEAVDLTIKAVDKNDEVVDDYEWSILIFSESDWEASFPNALEDNSYTFVKSDEWVIKFENAVQFKNVWKNDIHVYDVDDVTDSTMWLAELTVTEKTEKQNIGIKIEYPENGVTIGKSSISVSWTSKKNHQIKILVNWETEILTTTNKNWFFEKEIEDLAGWKNTFAAYILDSEWEVIWTSKEVSINSDTTVPIFNKLTISPEGEVEVESELSLELYASKWLSEVIVVLDDWSYELKEDKDWVYKSEILSPKLVGEYKIDVSLKDELWNQTEKKWVITLVTIEKIPELKAAEKKKKDLCPKWDYSWNLFDKKCGEKPEPDLNAPIDLSIKNMRVVRLKTKSVLTWEKLDDAVKYEVHKKTKTWEFELFETVTEPKIEIQITGDTVKNEHFAVKAIWKQILINSDDDEEEIEKEIQGDISDAVKIPTWPKEIVLIILSLLLGLWFLLFRQRYTLTKKS